MEISNACRIHNNMPVANNEIVFIAILKCIHIENFAYEFQQPKIIWMLMIETKVEASTLYAIDISVNL